MGTGATLASRSLYYPMRTLLSIVVLSMAALHGAEAGAPGMREKMIEKIKAAAAALPPPAPKPATVPGESTSSPILMQPVIVFESPLVREVTAKLERAEQERRDETFSPLKGGTVYDFGGMRLGSWWTPEEGWTFLRTKSNTPSHRQVERSKERIKELQDLFKIRESPKP